MTALEQLVSCLIKTPRTNELQWELFRGWFDRVTEASNGQSEADIDAVAKVAGEMCEYQCPDWTDAEVQHNWKVILDIGKGLFDIVLRQRLYRNARKEVECGIL